VYFIKLEVKNQMFLKHNRCPPNPPASANGANHSLQTEPLQQKDDLNSGTETIGIVNDNSPLI